MKKFIKNYSKIISIILLILFPIIFIGILKIFIKFAPGEMIGSIDGWLGFLGGYFGVIGTIGAVWWQLNESKKAQSLGSLKIYEYYFDRFLLDLHKDFSVKKMVENLLFITDDVSGEYGCFVLPQKDFTILENSFSSISSFSYSIDILKIINAFIHIEEIALSSQKKQSNMFHLFRNLSTELHNNSDKIKDDTIKNKLNEIYESLENEKINDLKNQIEYFDNFIGAFHDLKNLKAASQMADIYFYLKDIINILFENEQLPYIYTFEKLEIEINKVLKNIKKDIKKLS